MTCTDSRALGDGWFLTYTMIGSHDLHLANTVDWDCTIPTGMFYH